MEPSSRLLVKPVSPISTFFLARYTNNNQKLKHSCLLGIKFHSISDTAPRFATLPGKNTWTFDHKASFSPLRCNQHICTVFVGFLELQITITRLKPPGAGRTTVSHLLRLHGKAVDETLLLKQIILYSAVAQVERFVE